MLPLRFGVLDRKHLHAQRARKSCRLRTASTCYTTAIGDTRQESNVRLYPRRRGPLRGPLALTDRLAEFCHRIAEATPDQARRAAQIIGLLPSTGKQSRKGTGPLFDAARAVASGSGALRGPDRRRLMAFVRPLIESALAGRSVQLPSPLRCPLCRHVLGVNHSCPQKPHPIDSESSVRTVSGGAPGLGKRPRGVRRSS